MESENNFVEQQTQEKGQFIKKFGPKTNSTQPERMFGRDLKNCESTKALYNPLEVHTQSYNSQIATKINPTFAALNPNNQSYNINHNEYIQSQKQIQQLKAEFSNQNDTDVDLQEENDNEEEEYKEKENSSSNNSSYQSYSFNNNNNNNINNTNHFSSMAPQTNTSYIINKQSFAGPIPPSCAISNIFKNNQQSASSNSFENNLFNQNTNSQNLHNNNSNIMSINNNNNMNGHAYYPSSQSTPSFVNNNDGIQVSQNLNHVFEYHYQFEEDRNGRVEHQYTREIFDYLKEIQLQFNPQSLYMGSVQNDINQKMRAILIDWLVDVHIKFKLLAETLFMTVNLIDRYLEKVIVSRQKLQLVGVSAMLIACKFQEIYAPEIKDFIYVCDKAYSKEDILDMEGNILTAIEFSLTSTSALRFLERYSMLCDADSTTFKIAQYLIELALIEFQMIQYIPSLMGAASLFLANKITNKPAWNQQLTLQSQFSQTDLKPCAFDLFLLMKNIDQSSLQALKRKFSSSKHMQVGKINLDSTIIGPLINSQGSAGLSGNYSSVPVGNQAFINPNFFNNNINNNNININNINYPTNNFNSQANFGSWPAPSNNINNSQSNIQSPNV